MPSDSQKVADLHIHSTASDGTLAPDEIVRKARRVGLSCIALTDHDSVDNIDDALIAGEKEGVEIIPAVELSSYHNSREIHVLGYFIDWKAAGLRQRLKELVDLRRLRSEKMVEKLRSLGLDINWDDVRRKAGSANIGRPHIAAAMLEKGYISAIRQAFSDDYLGNNGKAYVRKPLNKPHEAISMILEHSGIAVLAHPGQQKKQARLRESDIREFISYGLGGLEVYHPDHDQDDISYYSSLADKHQLIISGGSDFHGDNKEGVLIGGIRLDYGHVEAMKRLSSGTIHS